MPRGRTFCIVALVLLVLTPSLAHAQRIYWTGEAGIRRAHLDGSNAEPVVTGAGGPIALDLIAGNIYFPGGSPRRIQRANLDGSDVQDVVSLYVHSVRSIALDLLHRKIYWIDDWQFQGFPIDGVFRADMHDGANAEDVLPYEGEPGLQAIALDPEAGYLYWVFSASYFQGILRGPLDRFAPEQLITEGLVNPSGLALDLVGGKVYWADMGLRRISRANLDGSEPEPLLEHNGNVWNVALDVRRAKVYWTDERHNAIYRANFDGSEPALFVYPAGPFGVAIDDRVPSDCDLNGQVDLSDLAGFLVCMTGTGVPVIPRCLCADENGDRDVDLADFAVLQATFGGA